MLRLSVVFFVALFFTITTFSQVIGGSRVDRILSERTFLHYSKDMRVSIIEDLYNNIKGRYALWDIKKERLGVDGDTIFKGAIEGEEGIEDEVLLEFQAKQNLDFLDRLKLIIAKFQDTHMGLRALNRRPMIYNGLDIKKIKGKFYVSSYSQKIMSYNDLNSENENYLTIKIGDEVVSIDSKSPQNLANSLAPYIDASSNSFREENSIEAISLRRFMYPNKSYLDYELKKKGGETYKLRLPWYYSNRAFRPDALTHFKVIGMKALDGMRIDWDDDKKKYIKDPGLKEEGYKKNAAPQNLIEKKEWMHSERERLSLRTGYILEKGKAVGVIQLYTYSVKNVYLSTDTGKESKDIIKVLRSFIKNLKDNEMPLIFDLRYNGGGSPRIAHKITSLLTKKDDKHAPVTWAFRLTHQIRQMTESWDNDSIENIDQPFSYVMRIDLLHQAIRNNSEYTFAYRSSEMIKADSEVDGYDKKIVMLLTPNCISACDIQSMLLKSAKRATILGTHSNGTGAGFTNARPYQNTTWHDDLEIISLRIPNFLFGRPFDGQLVIDEVKNSHYKRNSENIPVEADIQYEMTLEDLKNSSEGYYNKALELIFNPDESDGEEEEKGKLKSDLIINS